MNPLPLYIVLTLTSPTGQELAVEHVVEPQHMTAKQCLFKASMMAGQKITFTCKNQRPDRICVPPVDVNVWTGDCVTEAPR